MRFCKKTIFINYPPLLHCVVQDVCKQEMVTFLTSQGLSGPIRQSECVGGGGIPSQASHTCILSRNLTMCPALYGLSVLPPQPADGR